MVKSGSCYLNIKTASQGKTETNDEVKLMKTCPNGHLVNDEAKFCTKCGAAIPVTDTVDHTYAGQDNFSRDQQFQQNTGGNQYPPGQQNQQQGQWQPHYQQNQGQPHYQQNQGQQNYQQAGYNGFGAGAGAALTGFKGVVRSPGTVILLSIVTCGIYGIYWLYSVAGEINSVLGYQATNPSYSIIGLICFVFNYLLIYQIDKAMMEIDQRQRIQPNSKFLMWVLLTIFIGVGFFLMQYEVQSRLNSLYQRGR